MVGAVVLLVLFAMLVHTVVTNGRFQWGVVGDYFASGRSWAGCADAVADRGGDGLRLRARRRAGRHAAVAQPDPALARFGYVWLVRSVPLLVQLLFWYESPRSTRSCRWASRSGTRSSRSRPRTCSPAILAAFVSLTLDVAAFSSEIVRGGILAVERGQSEAAAGARPGPAGGSSGGSCCRRRCRRSCPATGNLLIGMLKATSIVSVIAVQDLLYSVQLIYKRTS